jgi:hypothetical protein
VRDATAAPRGNVTTITAGRRGGGRGGAGGLERGPASAAGAGVYARCKPLQEHVQAYTACALQAPAGARVRSCRPLQERAYTRAGAGRAGAGVYALHEGTCQACTGGRMCLERTCASAAGAGAYEALVTGALVTGAYGSAGVHVPGVYEAAPPVPASSTRLLYPPPVPASCTPLHLGAPLHGSAAGRFCARVRRPVSGGPCPAARARRRARVQATPRSRRRAGAAGWEDRRAAAGRAGHACAVRRLHVLPRTVRR